MRGVWLLSKIKGKDEKVGLEWRWSEAENDLPFGKEKQKSLSKGVTLRWDEIDQKHRKSQDMSKVGGWVQVGGVSGL